ncbi:MAG: PEP-CTERM sorting domain-containing protein [Armatimonadetes bacterium]|nr:PEP-CTERM sorting domain-containing protein [Armatimonadota bacterium]
MNKLVLVGLAVLALPTLGRANLITDGGFELNPLQSFGFPLGPPFVPGIWGVEYAARVTTGPGGIIPKAGNWMLDMNRLGGVVTQGWQFNDITGLEPLHKLEVEAWYNSDADAAVARLNVGYYKFHFAQSFLSGDSRSITLDDDPTTWEGLYFLSTIPQDATWVHFQVMFDNNSLNNPLGPNFSGFVDSASLGVVPEPASMFALGIGLAALAARRRSKVRLARARK